MIRDPILANIFFTSSHRLRNYEPRQLFFGSTLTTLGFHSPDLFVFLLVGFFLWRKDGGKGFKLRICPHDIVGCKSESPFRFLNPTKDTPEGLIKIPWANS